MADSLKLDYPEDETLDRTRTDAVAVATAAPVFWWLPSSGLPRVISQHCSPVARLTPVYFDIPLDVAGRITGPVNRKLAAVLPIFDESAHGNVEQISWIALGEFAALLRFPAQCPAPGATSVLMLSTNRVNANVSDPRTVVFRPGPAFSGHVHRHVDRRYE